MRLVASNCIASCGGADLVDRDVMIAFPHIVGLPTGRISHPWQTLTLDNGTENAGHEQIAQHKGMAVYFADPHAPCQRGGNEQINGLTRRYFPKGTDYRNDLAQQKWTPDYAAI